MDQPRSIAWLSNADVFRRSLLGGELQEGFTGGIAYNLQAASALSQNFSVEVPEEFVRKRNESLPAYALRISRLEFPSGLAVLDPMVFTFCRRERLKTCIGMVHHIDFLRKSSSPGHWAYLSLLERRIRSLGQVVVVSEFWKDYVLKKGAVNVSVIYNSFDMNEFRVGDGEVQEFSERFGIPDDRPMIYLGMASSIKGSAGSFEALKEDPYTFFATGVNTARPDPRLRVEKLTRRDYILMLHRADATVTMPLIPEGWSRVAHESLLCRTPVIGIRSGGMTELLEKSGQRIISSERELRHSLSEVLSRREEYAEKGFEFVKQFDLEYFNAAWNRLCEGLQ